MALFISSSVSVAAECADDPNGCTLKMLCKVATTVDGGNTIWSTEASSAKHVSTARTLGMECGITPTVDLCDTDPSECKLSQICGKATFQNMGQTWWDDSAAAYVAFAKEYGLSCDVKARTIMAKKTCFYKTPEACGDQIICNFANAKPGSPLRADTIEKRLIYFKEAKKRGLTCVGKAQTTSVKKTCSRKNSEVCSTQKVCSMATLPNGGSKIWDLGSWAVNYVKEAKKRGLTCGVKAQNTTCSLKTPQSCTDNLLCTKATFKQDWSQGSQNKIYVEEAKKRGLTCGVKAQATSVKKACTPYAPVLCDKATLCINATKKSGNFINWDKHHFYQVFVKEAKKRGLTCGVIAPAASPFGVNDFNALNLTKRKQLQYGLKKLGYYNGSVDGKYGPNTQGAVRGYANDRGITSDYPNSVYKKIISEVDVPSSFSKPKIEVTTQQNNQSTSTQSSQGYTSYNKNPKMSVAQALDICTQKAGMAGDRAASDAADETSSYKTRCRGNSSRINCDTTKGSSYSSNGEAFLVGVLEALNERLSRSGAAKKEFKLCMSENGWKKNQKREQSD